MSNPLKIVVSAARDRVLGAASRFVEGHVLLVNELKAQVDAARASSRSTADELRAEKNRVAFMEHELKLLRARVERETEAELAMRWDALRADIGTFRPTTVFRAPTATFKNDIPAHVGRLTMRATGVYSAQGQFTPYIGSIVPDSTVNERRDPMVIDMETPQGAIGTPYTLVPMVDQKQGADPYSLRGLSYDQGEMVRLYRGHPHVQSAVDRRIDIVLAGRWEFAAPDVDNALLMRLGITRDELERQAEELNLELVRTADVAWRMVRYELLMDSAVSGFALQEFGLNPFRPPGQRVAWVSPRTPSSVMSWILTSTQGLAGFTQSIPTPTSGTAAPAVDIRRCLYAVRRKTGANYEGISDLRTGWTWARVIAEYIQSSLLNRQRFGSGVPVVNLERNIELTADTITAAQRAVQNFVNRSDAALTAPAGVNFDMLQIQPDPALVPVIELCVRMMRDGLDASLFGMGVGDASGSRALGETKADMMMRALAGYCQPTEEAFDGFAKSYVQTCYGTQHVYPVMRATNISTRTPSEVIELRSSVVKLRTDGAPDAVVEAAAVDAGLNPDDFVENDDPNEARTLDAAAVTTALALTQAVGSGSLSGVAGVELLRALGMTEDTARRVVKASEPLPEPVAPEPLLEPAVPGTIETRAKRTTQLHGVLSLTPEKYRGLDLTVTQGMREAADGGMAWRAKAPAAERSLSSVHLARQRSLSSKRSPNPVPLSPSTWRVLHAWFQRRPYATGAGLQQGSAEWQQWQAHGGDAGRERAAQVAAALERADKGDTDTRALSPAILRRACTTVAAPMATRAAAPRVRSECRDGVFVTFRALTPAEQNVALNTIRAAVEDGTELAARDLEVTRRAHRDAFALAARDLIANRDAAGLARLDVDFVGAYADTLRDHVEGVAQFAVADMRDEIRAAVPGAKPVPQPQRAGVERDNQLAAAITLAAQRLNDRTLADLRGMAVNTANGGPVSDLTRLPVELGHASTQIVASAIGAAVAVGRDYAASEGPRVKRATYSAVLDWLTCGPCASLDGTSYRYPSAEYERVKPPNPRCGSVKRTGGANECRCIMVYEFDADDLADGTGGTGGGSLITRAATTSRRPTLVIVTGPPTSGKSSEAKRIEAEADEAGIEATIISTDDLLGLDNGETWTPVGSAEARAVGLELLIDALVTGEPLVVFDGPLMTVGARAQMLAEVRDIVPEARVIAVGPAELDVEKALERNAARPPTRQIDPNQLARLVESYRFPSVDEGFDAVETFGEFDAAAAPVMRAAAESFKPTATMAEEAQRGLDWRAEFNRGGTEVGVARARDIANGRNLSADTVRRMRSYFARHEIDKQGAGWKPGTEGYPSAGRIAWALWGGDAGRAWAESRSVD